MNMKEADECPYCDEDGEVYRKVHAGYWIAVVCIHCNGTGKTQKEKE